MHPARAKRTLLTLLSLALLCAVIAACTAGGGSSDDDDDDDDDAATTATPTPTVTPTLQIQSPAFTVQPGEEMLRCYYTTLPSAAAVDVGTIDFAATGPAVQVVLFRTAAENFPDGTFDVCGGGASVPMWVYGGNGASGSLAMPDGTGIPMKANQPVILQIHFVNPDATAADGQVTVSFGLRTEAVESVGTLFTYNANIAIPANSVGSASGICDVPDGGQFFLMTTYARKLSTSVRANRYNGSEGALLIESTDFEHPEVATFSPPLTFSTSEQLAYTCDYNNTNSFQVNDGDSVNDEACITASYFFPATANDLCINSTTLAVPF